MKMKRQGQTELPRFVVGALATAGASVASGATVQITFANNIVTNVANGGVSNFTGDLTGDGTVDANGFAFSQGASVRRLGTGAQLASAYRDTYFGHNVVRVPNIKRSGNGVPVYAEGVARISFNDNRINGGLKTDGWLELEAEANNPVFSVKLVRLIFDDASTVAPLNVTATDSAYQTWVAVPEPSSLGLLALGAGGLLARRRRSQAA